MEETLAIIKPDAFWSSRGIMNSITKAGFEIVARRTVKMTTEQATGFYKEHEGQRFFPGLIVHMTSGMSRVMVLRKEGAIAAWRALQGPTNPTDARVECEKTHPMDDSSWTIRAKYGSGLPRNATHGSDSVASASREIAYFFSEDGGGAGASPDDNTDADKIETKDDEPSGVATPVHAGAPVAVPPIRRLSATTPATMEASAPPPPTSSTTGKEEEDGDDSDDADDGDDDVLGDLPPRSSSRMTATGHREETGFLAERRQSVCSIQSWAVPTGVHITDPTRVFTVATGEFPSKDHRIQFYYKDDSGTPLQISPWHDIPLSNPETGTFNMLVEIPKWTRAKMEIDTKAGSNPIKQDIKDGELREYKWGDMSWNYGAFPQTWEDPAHTHADTGAAGDDDPLDVIEVGCRQRATGAVVPVKVLGVLAMIDDGETDWKVLVVAADDPLAMCMDTLDDLNRELPGCVDAITHWLKMYKSHKGVINDFAFDGAAQDKAYAEAVIEETHGAWKNLVKKRRRRLSAMSGAH